MKSITALSALVLVGCAAPNYDPITDGTPYTVEVSAAVTSKTAEAAEAHCQKYGRHAQFAKRWEMMVYYNCVD